VVDCQLVDAEEAYCTVQVLTSTGALPRFRSSTKSFVNGAPVLPPPANTWLTTTVDVAPWANGAASSTPATASART
jgi:hypothetical protein